MTTISDTITFGGLGLDRAANLRTAEDTARLWNDPRAKVLLLWGGSVLIEDGAIAWRSPSDLGPLPNDAIFIALVDEAPIFAVQPDGDTPPAGLEPGDLRRMLREIDVDTAALLAAALGCRNWHRSHQYCGFCGTKTVSADAGWRRDCPGCEKPTFPRTDPVVIMLVTHGDDVLLGRSPGWPDGMYSLLAGFMEPGETIEAAVRRETIEEVNIPCDTVTYVGSQPWPLPGSLMIGCVAQATHRDITIDPAEIEHARWFTRQEIAQAFAGENPDMRAPNQNAIAGVILRNWLADTL